MRTHRHPGRREQRRGGFTLIEVLLATVTLALAAAATASVYMAGIRALKQEM